MVKFGNMLFYCKKVKAVDFSETFAASDLKFSRSRHLIDIGVSMGKPETSRKHLRSKVTPDLHLTYSKNEGNLGSESK